MKFIVLNLH